jgi:hypothetical protein
MLLMLTSLLRCFAILVAVIVSRPMAWGLALLRKGGWAFWDYRVARSIDPSEQCWLTRYLRREEAIIVRGALHCPPVAPPEPVQYLEAFVQEFGVCFEAFILCQRLVELCVREGGWADAERLLERGYQLGATWFQMPPNMRERSPYDWLIPNIVADFIVGLWVVQQARQQNVAVAFQHRHEGWLVKVAQAVGIDTRILWGVWYPEARRQVRTLHRAVS